MNESNMTDYDHLATKVLLREARIKELEQEVARLRADYAGLYHAAYAFYKSDRAVGIYRDAYSIGGCLAAALEKAYERLQD